MGDTVLDLPWHHLTIVQHLPGVGQVGSNSILEVVLQTNLQVRPEMGKSWRGVEVDIVGVVHPVLMPFQVAKSTVSQSGIIIAQFLAQKGVALEPNGSSIRDEVELIENSALVPIGEGPEKIKGVRQSRLNNSGL